MEKLNVLKCGPSELVLSPELGGSIAKLNVYDKPVLRSWAGDESDLFSLASNVLIPFSNRISGEGFFWDKVWYGLKPNMESERFPIHGDAFQKPWGISKQGESVQLKLTNGSFGPWQYSGKQVFNLYPNNLNIALTVKNTGRVLMPFGCGFHPWFPRTRETKLSFRAKTVWMEDKNHLPTTEVLLTDAPDWCFNMLRNLPSNWINNGYTGWDGVVRIEQGQKAVSCTLSASRNLSTALVYSPDSSSDFFCFEPVSHPVNAINLRGRPGLKVLKPGDSITASINLNWNKALIN